MTPKLVAKILATNFGFVPDWWLWTGPELKQLTCYTNTKQNNAGVCHVFSCLLDWNEKKFMISLKYTVKPLVLVAPNLKT